MTPDKKKTLYIILRSLGSYDLPDGQVIPDVWAKVGEIEAHSAATAISHVANDLHISGEFVAVPERSFRPVEGEWETAPRFVIKGQTTLV